MNKKLFYHWLILTAAWSTIIASDNKSNALNNTELGKILKSTRRLPELIAKFDHFLQQHPECISTTYKPAQPYLNNQTVAHILANENCFELIKHMVDVYNEDLATPIPSDNKTINIDSKDLFIGSTAYLILSCKLRHLKKYHSAIYENVYALLFTVCEQNPYVLNIPRQDGLTPATVIYLTVYHLGFCRTCYNRELSRKAKKN